MAIVVQKYGGSSVGDAGKIKSVARRIAKDKDRGIGDAFQRFYVFDHCLYSAESRLVSIEEVAGGIGRAPADNAILGAATAGEHGSDRVA